MQPLYRVLRSLGISTAALLFVGLVVAAGCGTTEVEGDGGAQDSHVDGPDAYVGVEGGVGCTPACGTRTCGPDPVCGVSCGPCDGSCEGGVCVSSASAPRVLSLSTNITSMTPKDTLVVSAIVTDPDGIDDLIGGTLNAASGKTYGAFATAASEGAYSLTLRWADLNLVEPIAGGTTSRTLRADFFDVAGHTASQAVEVSLVLECGPNTCPSAGECKAPEPLECSVAGESCSVENLCADEWLCVWRQNVATGTCMRPCDLGCAPNEACVLLNNGVGVCQPCCS